MLLGQRHKVLEHAGTCLHKVPNATNLKDSALPIPTLGFPAVYGPPCLFVVLGMAWIYHRLVGLLQHCFQLYSHSPFALFFSASGYISLFQELLDMRHDCSRRLSCNIIPKLSFPIRMLHQYVLTHAHKRTCSLALHWGLLNHLTLAICMHMQQCVFN